jgi:DNA polymerase III subunit beta
MKLTLTQPDLNHALRTVSRAVASGRTHPVLAHVLLTTGKGGNLQVSAYDLDLGITTPAPAIIDTAGSITIPYRLLADIIGRLEATDVVTLAATGTDVTVTTLSGAYKLSGGPAEDFPALPAVVVADAASVAFEAAVLPAASTDEAKQILTGVHLRIAAGVMTQEATDGHRLAVRSCAIDATDMDIVIPARSIRRIDGNVLLAIDNHQAAMVTADGTTIISRTLDGTYPNIQELIPTSYSHTLTCNRIQLLHAIERVSAIGDIIKFTVAKSLSITAETDVGSGAESLAVTGTLPPCAFNAPYLIDGLKSMPGDTVTISANTFMSPVVFTPTGIDGVTYLVMPMQIRG